jgi:hydroxymethylglutaryl-CoA lyase
MNKILRLIEVGPRDGLQNEKTYIPLAQKISFVEQLIAAGCKEIELTSFVRKDKIPQLADAVELWEHFKSYAFKMPLWILIPNSKGLNQALQLGVKHVAFFTSPSELFNQKNINSSVSEGLARIEEMMQVISGIAVSERPRVRVYLSMVFGCPYEGAVAFQKSLDLIDQLLRMGIRDIELGDTIGVAVPTQVSDYISQLKAKYSLDDFGMHFHDTKGMALVNAYTSYLAGIRTFSSSAGGLGGCPYAVGSAGNVASEEMCQLFTSLGESSLPTAESMSACAINLLSKMNRKPISKLTLYHQSKLS